jgi:hypothetical protein
MFDNDLRWDEPFVIYKEQPKIICDSSGNVLKELCIKTGMEA